MTDGSPTRVAIVCGSHSDADFAQDCAKYLKHFGLEHDIHYLSAHRNPDETAEFARRAEEKGYRVIIAMAGMAAHLPGVIAAHTTLPVIGVPLPGSALNGVDALYSVVQMPAGIPVGTMAVGKAGAQNAAVYAAHVLAVTDRALKQRLVDFRKQGACL